MRERLAEEHAIDSLELVDDDSLFLLHGLRQQEGRQHWGDRERRQERAQQRIPIGPGHRREYLPFYTLHSEEGNEGGDDDRHGEENGGINFAGAGENLVHLRRLPAVERSIEHLVLL